MRHPISALVLLSLAVACTPQAEEAMPEAAAPAVSVEEDLQAVTAVGQQELAAFRAGSSELGYLTDDAVLMPPDEPAVMGIAAIQAWATGFHSAVTLNSLDYDDTEIVIGGDWAIERYSGSVTFTPEGGEPVFEYLKGIHIYQRQPDGSWKMAQDIWNYHQEPEED